MCTGGGLVCLNNSDVIKTLQINFVLLVTMLVNIDFSYEQRTKNNNLIRSS